MLIWLLNTRISRNKDIILSKINFWFYITPMEIIEGVKSGEEPGQSNRLHLAIIKIDLNIKFWYAPLENLSVPY